MKIAYILPSLVNTGPIVVVHNIVKYLNGKVDLIDVYYFDETPSTLNFDCNVFHIKKSDIIDFDRYDIIHTHTLWADVFIYKNRHRIKKAKTVSTLHQDTFTSFTIQFNHFVSFFLGHIWCHVQRSFDSVIAISDQIKDRYSKLFKNIHTIYNGCSITENVFVDQEIKNLILSYKNMGFKILGSYAYISKRKGLSQVIEVLKSHSDCIYVIFGEGPYLHQLKKEVEESNLEARVLFLPYVNAPYSYLELMDIYMMPSYSEGFGLAMVEAALAKRSIVCSNLPSFHEIFTENDVCFFDLDDLHSLHRSIDIALRESETRGASAYHRASTYFTAEIMAANHLRFYENMLKGEKGS